MPTSLYELVKALRYAPLGSWLSVNLAALPGSTPAAKQSSTASEACGHARDGRVRAAFAQARRLRRLPAEVIIDAKPQSSFG
jgi:hypothetical protein